MADSLKNCKFHSILIENFFCSDFNAFEIFKEKHIPNSIFVDLELISDPESNIPHMMPNEDYFSKKVYQLI